MKQKIKGSRHSYIFVSYQDVWLLFRKRYRLLGKLKKGNSMI